MLKRLVYGVKSYFLGLERRLRFAGFALLGEQCRFKAYDQVVSGSSFWKGWLDDPDGRLVAFVREDNRLQFRW